MNEQEIVDDDNQGLQLQSSQSPLASSLLLLTSALVVGFLHRIHVKLSVAYSGFGIQAEKRPGSVVGVMFGKVL